MNAEGTMPRRRGGDEWGPPLTAEEGPPPMVDAIAARRAALAAQQATGTSTNGTNGTAVAVNTPAAPTYQPRQLVQLANFDRVREMLRKYQLDAVICAVPHNVFYLSGLDSPPLWEFPWYAFAMVPLEGEPTLILSQLGLSAPAEAKLWAKELYPYAHGDIINYDASALLESERAIKDLRAQLVERRTNTIYEALARALKDNRLEGKRIGFDDSRLMSRLPLNSIQPFDAIEMMREVRMIKTEPEIERMRIAAIANEEAAMEGAKYIPYAANWNEVVDRYRAELALRGGDGRYYLGGSPHHTGTHQHMLRDYSLGKGEFFMVDALGTKGHYFGDFGRTVSWGEPNPEALRLYNAMRKGLEAGLSIIKPGLKVAQLSDYVVEVVRREGLSAFSVCVPHSVGLEHTDMPRVPGITIQANMTMNLDIAYLEAGFGALHLEDTFVVRQDGVQLLTSGQTEMQIVG